MAWQISKSVADIRVGFKRPETTVDAKTAYIPMVTYSHGLNERSAIMFYRLGEYFQLLFSVKLHQVFSLVTPKTYGVLLKNAA